MKTFLACAGLFLAFTVVGKTVSGQQVQLLQGRVSVQATDVPLSRLLDMLDQATGLKSTVPPELADRTISARFDNLDLNDAVRRIFEGQPLDYVYVEGKGVMVTGLSKQLNPTPSPAPQTAATPPPGTATPLGPPVPPQSRQPEPQPPVLTNTANPPATVQNPAGTVPPQQVIPPASQPIAPMGPTGQTPPPPNPFNSTLPGFMAPNSLQQGTPTPGSTNGIPSVNSPFNTTFFNTSPWSYPTPPPTSGFPGTPAQPANH